MFNIEQLSQNIKKFRTAKSLSQMELAAVLGVSAQSVSKWECGISVPDIENLCLLADIFNISIDILLGNTKQYKKIMIGVDGGGSKTEFILFDEDGEILDKTALGACNPNAIGIEKSAKLLKNGIDRLMLTNSNICGIYIGSSGFLTGRNDKNIKAVLNNSYPHIKIKCNTDIMNVIASVPDIEKCIAVICGTGSIVYAKEKEKLSRMTGWGYLLSKSGSGFDIGRDALYSVLQDVEHLGSKTCITEMVHLKLGKNISECISEIYKNDQSYIASFAPIVFKAYQNGDKTAKDILEKNAQRLAFVINKAYENYDCGNQVILSGGIITNNAIFSELVKQSLNPDLKVIIPKCPQSLGACLLCAKMCGCDVKKIYKNFMTKRKMESIVDTKSLLLD